MKEFSESRAYKEQLEWEAVYTRGRFIGSRLQKQLTALGICCDSIGLLSIGLSLWRHEPISAFVATCAVLRCIAQWIATYIIDKRQMASLRAREESVRSQIGCAYYEGGSDVLRELTMMTPVTHPRPFDGEPH